MGTRDAGIDLARVVGIVAIVAGHVWVSNSTVYAAVYPWHVPLFFFLTGYLWKPQRSLRSELRGRATTLGLPYLTWFVILAVPFFIWAAKAQPDQVGSLVTSSLLGGSYAGRPFSAFWFVGALFAVALLYRSIQALPLWAHVAVALICLAISMVFTDFVVAVPLGFGLALPALVFVVAGRLWRVAEARLPARGWLALAVVVLCALLVATGISRPVNLKPGDLGTPVLSVVVAILLSAAILELCRVAARLIPWASSTIVLLGTTGFTVVLAHGGVLWLKGTPDAGGWDDFLLALVAPWLIGIIALYTPASRPLTGASRRTLSRIRV